MIDKMTGVDIHPTYNVPKEEISCPGCGKLYTTRRVCVNCEECVKCCICGNRELISGKAMIAKILNDG